MKKYSLYSGILEILLGVLLIVFKGAVLQWAITLFAIIFIVLGIVDLTKNKTAIAIIELIVGILAIVLGWTLVKICVIIFAIILLIKGLVTLSGGLQVKHLSPSKKIYVIVAPIIIIIASILILLNINTTIDLYFIISGVFLIAEGLIDIIFSNK